GVAREPAPVGPELKLHRDAGDDADREVEAEQPRPEPRGVGMRRVAAAERSPLEIDDEPRQAHRQLREEIVIRDREAELQAVPEGGVAHDCGSIQPPGGTTAAGSGSGPHEPGAYAWTGVSAARIGSTMRHASST